MPVFGSYLFLWQDIALAQPCQSDHLYSGLGMMYPPTSKISATCAGYFNENETRIVREDRGVFLKKLRRWV